MLRIGHKGADAIAPGNTLESFAAAVDAGVEVIELDVLRPQSDFGVGDDWRGAAAGPAAGTGPLSLPTTGATRGAARRSPWGTSSTRSPTRPWTRSASTST